jgi:hypothetical protein
MDQVCMSCGSGGRAYRVHTVAYIDFLYDDDSNGLFAPVSIS